MNSKLFKFIRQSKGLTQTDLARILGVSTPLISMIEKNKKNISDDNKKKLREAFGDEYISECRTFLGQN